MIFVTVFHIYIQSFSINYFPKLNNEQFFYLTNIHLCVYKFLIKIWLPRNHVYILKVRLKNLKVKACLNLNKQHLSYYLSRFIFNICYKHHNILVHAYILDCNFRKKYYNVLISIESTKQIFIDMSIVSTQLFFKENNNIV